VGIELNGKTEKNLTPIPLFLEEGRLVVSPNNDNCVYVIEGHLFHYQLLSENNSDIARNLARASQEIHSFKNRMGSFGLMYVNIELWDRIPDEFRDVFFYHEAVEVLHTIRGFLPVDAHQLARMSDLNYRMKYLSLDQQVQFLKMEQQLESYARELLNVQPYDFRMFLKYNEGNK